VFVAFGSMVFLKERPPVLMFLGATIALLGTILISFHDYSQDNISLTGNLLALCGAVGAAGYLLAGRKLRAELETFPYVTAVYSATAVILVLLAIGSGASFFHYDLKIYLLLLAVAFIPQVIGHTSINWSLKYFSATAVSIIILWEPIGASILAIILLGERITLFKIFGGVIILCGVILALVAEAKFQKKKN
jgi:drug/metabolite transporter (DMT)-like permease